MRCCWSSASGCTTRPRASASSRRWPPPAWRPSWRYLFLLGLVGGGPTFLGTLVGHSVVNDTLSIGFLTLAGGSILYVVIELLAVARKQALKEITTWGILLGVLLGFATDAIVTAAGA